MRPAQRDGLGLAVEGVDPVPEFIERARMAYPGQRFRVGRAEALKAACDSIGGVLAWYSLIHAGRTRSFAFRRYEDASLSYTGIESHAGLRRIGGFNTVIAVEANNP